MPDGSASVMAEHYSEPGGGRGPQGAGVCEGEDVFRSGFSERFQEDHFKQVGCTFGGAAAAPAVAPGVSAFSTSTAAGVQVMGGERGHHQNVVAAIASADRSVMEVVPLEEGLATAAAAATVEDDDLPKNCVREGRWTEKEHAMFLEGYRIYGKSWKDLSRFICTRTPEQIRTHAQKYFAKHEKPRRASVDTSKRAKLEGLSYDTQPALQSLSGLPTHHDLRLPRLPVCRSQSGNLLGGGGSRPRSQSFDVSYQQRPRSDSTCSTAESDYTGPLHNMALSILIKELEEQHNSSSTAQQGPRDQDDEDSDGEDDEGRGKRRKRASAVGGWKNKYSSSEWADEGEGNDEDREEDGDGYDDEEDDDSMDEKIIVGFRGGVDGEDDYEEEDDIDNDDESEEEYGRQRRVHHRVATFPQSRRSPVVKPQDVEDDDDDDEEYRLGDEEVSVRRRSGSGGSSKAGGANRIREGRWSREEHSLFLRAYKRYGKAWKDISRIVVTRTPEQIRTHAQKYFQKQNRHRGSSGGGAARGRGEAAEVYDDSMSIEGDEEIEQQDEERVTGSVKGSSRAARPRRSISRASSSGNLSTRASPRLAATFSERDDKQLDEVDDNGSTSTDRPPVTTSEGTPSSPDAESRMGGGTTEESDMEIEEEMVSSDEDPHHHKQQGGSRNRRKKGKEGRWTDEEHNSFLKGLKLYGKSWRDIQTLVKTRTPDQIRTHAQKYFIKLGKFDTNHLLDGAAPAAAAAAAAVSSSSAAAASTLNNAAAATTTGGPSREEGGLSAAAALFPATAISVLERRTIL